MIDAIADGGRLLAIEGPPGSGKGTQAAIVAERTDRSERGRQT